MSADTTPLIVDTPGIYDLPEDAYHSDPVPGGSLSSTGARKLLPPSCPARFRYDADNSPASKPQFDFGSAAHKLVLGAGPEIVVIDADSWRTKAAKEERDGAYAGGAIPLLAHEWDTVARMSKAIRSHPIASALFDPDAGKPEQSLFWTHDPTGVWRRARLDWLPDPTSDGQLVIGDYKTTTAADPDSIAKTVARFGYHQQAAWYLDAVDALLDDPAVFVLVFQEKEPPYLVTVVELDVEAIKLGRRLNNRALNIYAECVALDTWPGYADRHVEAVSLPAWAHYADGGA